MKHDRHRTALEQRVAEQNRLIADVAASVSAPVPNEELRTSREAQRVFFQRLRLDCFNRISRAQDAIADEKRAIEGIEQFMLALDDDDEDAILDEGEPREIPLTEAQKLAEYWDEKTDADEAWREEEDE